MTAGVRFWFEVYAVFVITTLVALMIILAIVDRR